MQRVLLIEADHTFRLRLVGMLSERFELVVPPAGEDPLRLARSSRPDIALIAAGERARPQAIRLARVLKTDVRAVPRIGLYIRPEQDGPSAAAFASTGAEGFAANVDADAVVALLDALLRGERPLPTPWPRPQRSLAARIVERLRG